MKGQVPFSADLNYMNFYKHGIRKGNTEVSLCTPDLKSSVFSFALGLSESFRNASLT